MGTPEPAYRVLWDEENRVVHLEWLPASVCDLEQARGAISTVRALRPEPVPLLVDMRNITKLDRDAREEFTRDQSVVRSMALVVGSPVTRMMANFVMGMRRFVIPLKMFDDEVTALRWLREQA